jgi:predicted phosphodiesterase
MKKSLFVPALRPAALLLLAPAAPVAPAAAASPAAPLVATGFEKTLPPGANFNKLTADFDPTRARSGRASLRITSEPKATWGYLAFELDDKLDFDANYEFSAWVYTEAGATISLYISADDGTGGRYTAVNGTGAVEPGKWCRLSGTLFAGDWRRQDREYRFIVRARGTCWIDDLALRSGLPDTPAQVWPRLENALHAAADTRASSLKPGGSLVLDARHAALAPDTARVEVLLPAPTRTEAPARTEASAPATRDCNLMGYIPASAATPGSAAAGAVTIPADGLLAFAIDAADDLDVTGILELHHAAPVSTASPPASLTSTPASPASTHASTAASASPASATGALATPSSATGAAAPHSSFFIPNSSLDGEAALDLRPGLRATVLADDTVIAAPAVKTAAPWRAVRVPRGGRTIFGLPPGTLGERPAATVPLAPFRLAKGRHYLVIAGPHIRPAGTLARLELRAAPRPAEKPLHTFALLSDTHLGFNRREWRNTLLGSATGAELEAVLRRLKREGAAYAIIAGDLTDDGRRAQFEDLAAIVKRAALPVYGCIGNHDTSRDSRADIAAAIPKLFPAGAGDTEYTLSRPPLRFVILDGSYYKDKNGGIQGHKDKHHETTTYRDDLPEWLRDTLAADTVTPTIIVSHYPFYFHRGVSPVSGYDRGKPWLDKKLADLIDAAPNVVATLSGHLHHNETSMRNGIVSLQNPAFAEWPDAYRVFRVYRDRLEWEIRQIPNRGLIREGVIPETALLWQLSTDPADLAGTIPIKTTDKNH